MYEGISIEQMGKWGLLSCKTLHYVHLNGLQNRYNLTFFHCIFFCFFIKLVWKICSHLSLKAHLKDNWLE